MAIKVEQNTGVEYEELLQLTAGEDLDAGVFVAGDGTIVVAGERAVGMTVQACDSGDVAYVTDKGVREDTEASYTVGNTFYVDVSDGTITTTKGNTPQTAGVAISTTKVMIQLDSTLIDGNTDKLVEGTPLNAISATGTLTFSGVVADTDTVTIGADTYEFDTGGAVTEGNILVDVSGGVTASDAVTALVTASSSGTEPVTLTDGAGDTVVVTADVAGVLANTIATTDDCTNGSFAAITLTAGVDGTVGEQFQVRVDASYIYTCVAVNTIADANWVRVSNGSTY